MALTTIKSLTKRSQNGSEVVCKCGNFNLILDSKKDNSEASKGMTPMEAILCGIGGCISMMASSYCDKNGIELRDFKVSVEGDYDNEAAGEKGDARPGFKEIRCSVHIVSDGDAEKVQELIEHIKKYSPVMDSIKNSVNLHITDVVITQVGLLSSVK